MSGKRLNPFQSFIVKATAKPEASTLSPAAAAGIDAEDEKNWVHYIDDETGFPYMYNTVTGEARWLTEAEYQENEPAIVEIESPWETLYDNDGNIYYYNKETGASAWEIPAEDMMKYGLQTLENQDPSYFQNIGLDPAVSDQLSSNINSMNFLEEAFGEFPSDSVKDGSNSGDNAAPLASSLKSIRSARSFGLKTPQKGGDLESLADQVSSQLGIEGSTKRSSKKKTQLSFALGNKRSFKIDDSLKPSSPSKRKSKSGFEILKISSKVIRSGTDENGDVWLEFQSSDEGPIFYAKKGADGGQWRIPTTFNVVELDDSQDLDVAPPYTPKRDDATITPSETSLEVVDFFSLDKDDVLKIQSPSLKKMDPIQSVKAESGKEMASKPPVPSSSSSSNSIPQSSSAVGGGTTTTLPDIVVAKPAATPPSLQSLAVTATPTPTLPPSNMELKIQSIKAEAALELEKLRKRLESAKQDASAVNTRASLSLGNALPSPSSSSTAQRMTPSAPAPSLPSVAQTSTTAKPEPIKNDDGIAAVPFPTVTVQDPPLSAVPKLAENGATSKSTTSPRSVPPSSASPAAAGSAVSMPTTATAIAVKSDKGKLSPRVSHPPPLQVPISPLETAAISLKDMTPLANPSTTTRSPSSSLATTSSSTGGPPAVTSSVPPAAASSDNGKNATPISTTAPSATTTVVPKATITSAMANITGPDGEILWDEIVPRSHLLRTTIRWECFFDAQTKFKFYRRRRDGFLQKEKPNDFDTVFMSSNSLGLSTPSASSTAPESPSKTAGDATTAAASATTPSTSAPAHVSFAADVAETSSPSNKKMKKAKKSNRNKKTTDANGVGASSFLTGVDIGAQEDGDDDNDDENEEKLPTLPKPSAHESVQLVMPTEVEEDVLQQMMRELAFVERHSSRAIRAIYQERAQLEQHDAEQLTQRLQLLADKRLQMEESKRMRLTDRYVAGMDTDQVKRLQMRNKQLLERCYEIQSFIESSPIEHAMNEVQLLRAAILQREHLLFPGDLKHDQPHLHASPPELLFVSSHWTQPYWRAQTQHMDKCGWFKLRHYASPPEHVYYHSHAHCGQAGEPFDWFIRREASELKKEKWGDYEMKVSVSQSVLENAGIELYEDHKGGYVFHCPMRGTYSSNGRFDPIHFHATTGKPTNFRRKAPTASGDDNYDAWIKKLKPSIWKQLGLKADELAAMTSPMSSTLASALFASTKSAAAGAGRVTGRDGDGGDGDDDRAAWPMAASDSVGDLHAATQRSHMSATMLESMRKLKESAQKTSHVQDTLSSLTAVQVTKGKPSPAATKSKRPTPSSPSSSSKPTNGTEPVLPALLPSEKEETASSETLSTVKPIPSAYNLSILEEAFSIAKETYDPTTIMATNEELWKFEVDTSENGLGLGGSRLNDRGGAASATGAAGGLERDMDNRDGPALARVDVLKYEQRFDEDTMQRYQQLLIFAYQDPENPGHLLTLMEFLLQQGLNKAALAILQRAMHIMASYEHYKPGKYEQCLLQLLRSHLSIKGHGAFTSYGDVLKMVDVFPTQPLVLTAVASYFTRLHHLDWAKVLCVGALMQSPSYEMALVQLAQIAYLQGDLKHASRLLQRNGQENEHGRWSRKGKLEAAWLLEMLEADDEALVVGYKALIAVHTRDTVQSKTLLALGSLYQRMRKFRLAIDFYQRAWQMDRDDGMIPWCFATAQSVQYVQNRVIPSSIPAICVDNGGSYNTSAEANVVGDMMMAAATSGGEGGGRVNKGATPSERPLSAKATLTRTTRPKSAGATGRANTLRPSTTHHRSGENRPLVSTSFTALPASSAAKTTSSGQASASATARASPSGTAEAAVSSATISMAPSVIAQLPPNKKSTATVTVAEQTAKPLASVSLNATWKATADALYRRSLVLMADASYHWIALLSYGDFVLASMQDTKRALEYYEDATKESFSTQIWPIVALGGAYQYVTNDYAAAKRLFTRALWSRHPPTDSRQRSHRSQAAQLSTLVAFGGFLRKRMKGDHGHVASASQVSSSSQHGRRTRRHVYADDDGDQDQDEDGTAYFDGEEDNDLARGTGSMEDSHQRHRDDALRMLQSVTLSRVSYPNTHGHGGADTATMDGGCASAFQRRAQDTKNLTVQEKECQVLYIAIAYLLWDMHETDAAYRYALAALKLQPTYSPALRCVGFLVYYVHQDMRLAFRYFAAAAEAAFSTVDMVGNPDAAGTTTTLATTSSSSSSAAGAASASASASTSSSAMMMSTPRCHSLLALQTLAIVRGLRCQYDQAIAAMERVLIQSTTCRFAHRCLAVWYYHVKQHPEKALQHLHSAWELSDHRDVDVLRWKAQILMDAQAYQEARVCLLDALRLAPYDAISYANLAICIYFLHRKSTSPDSCVDAYEEARYVPRREKTSTSSDPAAAMKRYSVETLDRIAHSRDIQALFDVAKHIQAAHCRGSFAEFQTRQARRRTRPRDSPESPATTTTTTKTSAGSVDDAHGAVTAEAAYIHFLGGPTSRMTQLTSSTWSVSQASDDGGGGGGGGSAWFASPHSDGRDTSSSLAYVHFLQGCLDLMLAPSLADFGLDDEDDAAEARGAALAQAKQAFSLAAVYSQGCGASSATPHTIYPLALYHLGQIAEEENDLVTAERLMADAVAVEHIHPVTFIQLLDCITKNLTLHKQRLKELKRPYTKKGHKKRNGKTATAAADSLLGSTFSDTPDGKHQGTGSKPSHKSSKKTVGGAVDSSLDWLLRQSNQGRGFLDPGMAAVVQAVATTSKGDAQTVAKAEAMNGEDDDANEANSDDDDIDDDGDVDDDGDDDDRALLADVPVAVQNRTMERCFKRVMMHTRVQEALLLRKYQVGKVLKDVKLSYPKLSTYAEVPAGAATGRMSQKRRLMKKLSSQQAQLQLGLPMGALDMVKSFFYVDYDWLERCLYATAKCDDWASLLQCYHK